VERRIVTYIAEGLSDGEIAEYLHFSAGTIRNRLAAIKRRTKLKNRIQIVVFSLVYGLIKLDQVNLFKNHVEKCGHPANDVLQ
jgi:DNA-binding NarL/FixJ family response regulator